MLLFDEREEKASSNGSGFPSGCFILRSVSSRRLLDVASNSVRDSAPIILWPEKDHSLFENLRRPEADNQVFFIDSSGTLCARASGHAVDVEDGRLVLRHRHPRTQPYPNAYSHPPPCFRYDGTDRFLTADFECDPAFAGGTAWRAKTFYVTAIPRRRRRTILDGASGALASAFRNPLSLLGGKQVTAQDPVAAGTDDTFNLREDEVEELNHGDETEVDDDPARDRAVRVVGMTLEERLELGDKALARRRWEVVPLRTTATRNASSS
ncbi:hypothetical protein EDB92DRAFT_563017 [Lactarius akahatsu]|uniref:Uncharacterized protein n=1 Tax=Lactarius akahatsu TaxID=416441 RepID=A0AAD4QDZ8_9AGAM|nr:hypothetical protein EDB92DRAFT_563017 [Lactarius akahatsu]